MRSLGRPVRWTLLAGSLVTTALAVAAQNCKPPEEFKAKLAQPSAETLADLGAWFGTHEQYDCASQALASSLQMDPAQKDLSHVVFLFGASLYFSGNVTDAISALQQAESLGYRNVKLNSLLASALDGQRNYSDAEPEWRKVLEYEPESTEALDALASDLTAEKKYDAVMELLNAPRVGPQRSVKQYLMLGAACMTLGKRNEAAAALEEGLNTYPDAADVAQEYARVLHGLGRNDEAEMVLKLARERIAAQATPVK